MKPKGTNTTKGRTRNDHWRGDRREHITVGALSLLALGLMPKHSTVKLGNSIVVTV